MGSRILRFDVYNKTKRELFKDIDGYNKVHIISGNPEVLSNSLNNSKLLKNFTSKNSIIIPDGVGTIISSKLIGQPCMEKIAGIEVMDGLLHKFESENKSIYLLGAEESTLELCVKNIKIKYPKLKVAGFHNGFFDINSCEDIVNDIKNSKAHGLFVAMGSPRQEDFIIDNMNVLPCKLYMGVGGSFDIFAGKLKRAPKWMIKMGLEWLYRLSKEPVRIKRLGAIPKFIVKVVRENNKNN
ncbi:WecB/TagA/CpsF family glycosyltransferase [Haloimpatiens sp. FM7315]|uniref:WecB/TagA/CpsF family glycosyltransferase n=1 Tax=Haloimpatiens sp. FM7315 TaxID=3298609 RepID=UPI0035A356FD